MRTETVTPLTAQGPIGLFDSGIGGVTVLRELCQLAPSEDLIYLADQAHCPYGDRSNAELRALAYANTQWLLAQGAKLIVVACNTASAAALHWLRRQFPGLPFVGMVPAIKPAVMKTRSGVIGVLATPATIESELLHEVVGRWAGDVRVIQQGCPGLAEQIERGTTDTPQTRVLLERYLRPLLAAGADTIVLGCTHYPFLTPQIRRIVGPDVVLIDPSPAVARQVVCILHDQQLVHPERQRVGAVTYASTACTDTLSALVRQLYLPTGPVLPIRESSHR